MIPHFLVKCKLFLKNPSIFRAFLRFFLLGLHLRFFEWNFTQEVDVILAQGFDGEGLSVAYMNRLGKASGKKEELSAEASQ